MVFELSIAAVIIVSLGLGLVVYLNNPTRLSNRVFAFLSFFLSLWILANFFSDRFWLTEFWVRLTFAAAILALGSFTIFSTIFPAGTLDRKKIIVIMSILGFAVLSSTSLVVEDIYQRTSGPTGFNVYHGPLYFLYFIFILIEMLAGIISIVRRLRKARGGDKVQLQFFSIGAVTAVIIGVTFNLIIPVVIGGSEFSRYGFFAALPLLGFTSFAIIRHRLFNIRAIVARSLAYLFSVLSFAFVYGFLAYGVAQNILLRNILTTERSQQIFNIILAVILAFTFPTIRRFFEKVTDRIFYRDRYDPQHLMSSIGRILATEIALEPLTTKVIRVLEDEMRLADANIVVLGKKGEDGEKDSDTEKAIYYQTHGAKSHQDYKIEDLRSIRIPVIITDELASSDERQMLEEHSIRAAFALKTRDSQVGYLLLGDKRSGDIYSDQDIQTLHIIADELAVAIQNARAYTEIQRFNVTLREKIDQATHDLKHANHELKALDKAKDEFISMASHQLRTPLTAVRGYTSMVMDGDFGKISGEQKDTLKQAFDAATRMTRLVDDLLNVSRIQSGKFRIERAEVDLNKVLPEEVSLLDTTAKTKQVAITYNAPKTPVPTLLIDEGKTRQCLMNLMDNSIYYSSTVEGGGKVQVYLESDATHVIFRVVDNGIGVPKAQQPKLFKKFYRAPNAQKTRPDGTGLGLFLVGKVVRDQGGEIIFESEEGKGSTFGFKLPIKAAGEGIDASGKVVRATPTDEVKEPADTVTKK